MRSLRLALALAALAGTLAAVASAAPLASDGTRHAPAAPAARVVHLTFDDGPDPRWTPQVLALLRRYDAHATFFVLGRSVEAQPALARRIVREGHTIANHSYDHARLTSLSEPQLGNQIDRAEAAIRRATGVRTHLLRPPFGAIDARTRGLASARGYRAELWDVDPQDWRRPGAAAIVANVLAGVRPGATVLLHDGGGDRSQTVAALASVLETLRARGYTFTALS